MNKYNNLGDPARAFSHARVFFLRGSLARVQNFCVRNPRVEKVCAETSRVNKSCAPCQDDQHLNQHPPDSWLEVAWKLAGSYWKLLGSCWKLSGSWLEVGAWETPARAVSWRIPERACGIPPAQKLAARGFVVRRSGA